MKNGIELIPNNGELQIYSIFTLSTIQINIQDQGIGMTEEQMNRLGEPYFTTKEKGNRTWDDGILQYNKRNERNHSRRKRARERNLLLHQTPCLSRIQTQYGINIGIFIHVSLN